MIKRTFDIVFSLLGFCLLLPVFLIILILIAAVDGGSPVFVQERVGQGGRYFRLFKFRTMKQAAGLHAKQFDAGDHSRITALGKVLRRSKLDELPQLWNVLLGDMSLVGPRPEVREWTLIYPEKWKVVHTVRPGITDYASLEFHDEEEQLRKYEDPERAYREKILPRKLALNVEYVNNRSFMGDMKILFQTIKTIFVA